METFAELNLAPEIQKAVDELGYTKPSPIQAQALPILLGESTDFIGLAATGTGKTAAFAIPLLTKIDPSIKGVQAIILCPTRELCMQVSGQINILGKHKGIQSLPIYGGAGYDEQLRGLKRGIPVVVGTPGRVIDHLNRKTLHLDKVQIVVLDEADEMISMGFREDMETILATVPEDQNKTWLFSATMSGPVRKVADEFLTKPKQVQVNRTEMLSSGVEQICFMTQEKNKPEVLCKLIDAADDFYGVIFCQMKALVVDLTGYLSERGYKVDSLHGDMSQAARETAMLAFRQKRKKILVCTDVAARGLDVKDITHVVNYSLPREIDNYVHRIGRTARSGKSGIAMSLVTPQHRYLLNKIEAVTKSRFTEGKIPTRKEIGMKKIAQMLPQFSAVTNVDRAQALLDQTWKDALATMTAEEVAARFLSMSYPWVFIDEVRPPSMERTNSKASFEGPRRDEDRRGGGDRREKPSYSRDNREERAPRSGPNAYRKPYQQREETRDSRPSSFGDRKGTTSFKREERGAEDSRPKFFDKQAPRKDRAAKFQSLKKDGPAPTRSPREERFALGGEKRKAKSDFDKGPFAKFAKGAGGAGKKKSNADTPPRRRPTEAP